MSQAERVIPFTYSSGYYRLTCHTNGAMTISHNDNPPAPIEVWAKDIITAALIAFSGVVG